MERLRQQDLRGLLEFLRGSTPYAITPPFIDHLLRTLPRVNTPSRVRTWGRVMHEHPVLECYQRTRDASADSPPTLLSATPMAGGSVSLTPLPPAPSVAAFSLLAKFYKSPGQASPLPG